MSAFDRLAHETPIWVIMLALLLAMALAWEFGAWAHARIALRRSAAADEGDIGQVLTSVLGLLALLVAFTFGLALDRYETRRTLVVDEANALGTAYLRTSILDQPERLRSLLRGYAAERVTYGSETGRSQAQAKARGERLQAAIWVEANTQIRPFRTSAGGALILLPLNEAFDLASSRTAALEARVPSTVLIVLWLYAIVSAAVLGYAVGGPRRLHRKSSLVMFLLLTFALGMILDLDRPRGGSIHVPQTPMSDALSAMR